MDTNGRDQRSGQRGQQDIVNAAANGGINGGLARRPLHKAGSGGTGSKPLCQETPGAPALTIFYADLGRFATENRSMHRSWRRGPQATRRTFTPTPLDVELSPFSEDLPAFLRRQAS